MEENRRVVERYLAALPADVDTLTSLQHPEFIQELPQSGERIRGSENFKAIQERYADTVAEPLRVIGTEDRWTVAPTFTPVRIYGEGDTFTTLTVGHYPDGTQAYAVSILELRDGLVRRVTTFFAAPFDAPEWRSQWVERMS